MKLFTLCKTLFGQKESNRAKLRISHLKLGESGKLYEEYLRQTLHFEPVIRRELNQIIFFNVTFENVKFENYSYFIKEMDGLNRVDKIVLWSTYEEQEKAEQKIHQIKHVICSKFQEIGQIEDALTYLKPANCYALNADTEVRLGLRKIGDYGNYEYASELSFIPKGQNK